MSTNPLFDKYGQTIRDGTVIFKEGETGDRMYIIQTGSVRISKEIDGRNHMLAELGKGEFFGEMAIVSHTARSATAVAVGTVEMLVFDRAGFESMIGKNTRIAMSVIDKLSRRLMNANAQIQTLVRMNQRSAVALNLYNRFMECNTDNQTLTLNRAIEGIAEDIESSPTLVTEIIYGFETAGICTIESNAIRLRDAKRLVALAGGDT